MAYMITKQYTTHMVVYLQVLFELFCANLSYVLKFEPPKPKKKIIQFVHVFGLVVAFGSVLVSTYI